MDREVNGSRVSPVEPDRIRLPDEREAITHKFVLPFGEEDYVATGQTNSSGEPLYIQRKVDLKGYVTVGLYEDGRPGEIFLKIGKAGGMWRVYDALAIAISVGLQYGVPIEAFIRKFQHVRFDPSGVTKSVLIPTMKSIPDYIARWLKTRYPLSEEEPVVSMVEDDVEDEDGVDGIEGNDETIEDQGEASGEEVSEAE